MVKTMLKIAICDDEILICNQLKQMVSDQLDELKKRFEIICYTNIKDLLPFQSDFDIFFLDIQMPDINGIDFAKKIRDEGSHCALIFITALQEYVFDAFGVEAIDYICKPVDVVRLRQALLRAIKWSQKRNDKVLFVQTMYWSKVIKLNSIYYCEVINRKIYLHTQSGIVEYYNKIEEVEKQLDYRFIKCHRSYIINLDFLYEYTKKEVTLDNGDCIPISKLRRQEFMKTMLQYMKKREE